MTNFRSVIFFFINFLKYDASTHMRARIEYNKMASLSHAVKYNQEGHLQQSKISIGIHTQVWHETTNKKC